MGEVLIGDANEDMLVQHLLQRRSVIRSRHLLFNFFLLLLLAAFPCGLAINLLRVQGLISAIHWQIVYLIAAGCALLFILHLRSEVGQAARWPHFKKHMRSDLLERGLLAEVLNTADPRDLLDSSLRPSQQELEDEGIELPGDALQRIDFLLLNYRDLNWSRMQARLAEYSQDETGKAVQQTTDLQLSQLTYGECICLIDTLIDILEGRIGEEDGDG